MAENKAPFDWNEIANKIAWALVVGLVIALWTLYNDNQRQDNEINKLKDFNRYKALFWDTQSQDKSHINVIIDKWNDAYPDNMIGRYEWDKSRWPNSTEDTD